MRDPEVIDFRVNMLRLCQEAIDQREKSDDARLQFMHPADLDSSPQLAPNLHDKLAKNREIFHPSATNSPKTVRFIAQPARQTCRNP